MARTRTAPVEEPVATEVAPEVSQEGASVVNLTVEVIRAFVSDSNYLCLVTDKKFPDSEVEGDNDIVALRPRYVTARLEEYDDDFSLLSALYKDDEETVGMGVLSAIIKGAKAKISKIPHSAGDEYTTSAGETAVYLEDGYNWSLDGLQLSKAGKKMVDKLIDKKC